MSKKKHHGEIVFNAVKESKFNITELARLINFSRRALYNWFESEEVRPDDIYKIGRIIKHDFSKEFPEYFTPEDFSTTKVVNETVDEYNKLMEKYTLLMKSHIELQEKYHALLSKLDNK
jgi:hypothetical protein